MDMQSTYVDQSVLYGTTGGDDSDHTRNPPVQASRSFFIIDKSRMVGETDTIEDAKVVYLPENEFTRDLYHSRCSYLIGVADVYRNMTGEFPQSLNMAGCCYACRLLEPDYFMFLLGRPFEPTERVTATLQHISDIFHFFYHSPEAVMNKSRGDWETFTTNMTFVFSKIKDYVFRDPHSIPFMFQTLPYIQKGPKKKRSRMFLHGSHILRSCQKHEPIIGGCITFNSEIVCNQLSPKLMEKLQVVAGDGIELNTKSILADNVAPETVWVLEVYLTQEEAEDLIDSKKDLNEYQQAYDEMKPNPTFIDSAVTLTTRYHTNNTAQSSRNIAKPARRTGKPWRPNIGRSRAPERTPSTEDYYNIPSTLTSTPDVIEASTRSENVAVLDTTSPNVSVRFQKKQDEKSKEVTDPTLTGRQKVNVGSQRSRLGNDREMPQLHGRSEKRSYDNRPYDDPNEFVNISPAELSSAKHQTQNKQTTTSLTPENVPSLSPIPVSLSIPIPEHDVSEGNSSILGVPGSSDDERFATPSPNLRMMYTTASNQASPMQPSDDTAAPVPALDPSSCVDNSSSFQTADELSKNSRSPSPVYRPSSTTNLDTGIRVPNIYNTLQPTLSPPKSHPHRLARPALEESGDFVDSELLDQIIHETQLAKEFNELQVKSRLAASNTRRGRGSGRVSEGRDLEDEFPPALPPRYYDSDDEISPPQLPPHLPPRSQSADDTATFKFEELVGNSGEFTVVNLSPPAVPQRTSSRKEERVEYGVSEVEYTPPPSPPPRTHSRKKNHNLLLSTPFQSPSEENYPAGIDCPPTPPPRETTNTTTTTKPERDKTVVAEHLQKQNESGNSSPDHQHRDLTQEESQGRASSAEEGEAVKEKEKQGNKGGTGQLAEIIEGKGKELVTKIMTRSSSSSVDPVKNVGSTVDDETASGSSTVKTLTSDEEDDDDDDMTLSLNTAAARYQRQPSVSTPTAEGGNFESLSIPYLTDTPSGAASLSSYMMNTPDMTLNLPSMTNDLQNSTGTATDDEEGETRDHAIVKTSDMTRFLHQTLGRQTQAVVTKPLPQLETWCIYVQRQFNTRIVLAAKAGLQNDHTLLTELWKGLLPQLFAMDQGLDDMHEHEPNKGSQNVAVYHNTDQFCAVDCQKALYKFRHAIRFTHLEFKKNPELCQVSLLNSPKMVSQRVLGRETFYHYQKSTATDVFSASALVVKTAKQTTHSLISGDTPAHFL